MQRFAQTHVVGENPAQLVTAEMAKEIVAGTLIGPQFGVDPARKVRAWNAAEFGQTFAQGLRDGGIAKPLQAGFVQVRGLFQAQALGHGDQPFQAQIRKSFMRGLDGGGVEFQPAGIGQFDKSAGRRLQPLQVGGGEFDAFGLPFGGNGEPIDSAALEGEAGPQRLRGDKQPLKGGVAQILGFLRAFRPGGGKRAEKIVIGVAHPNTGFRREPIQAPQPLNRLIQSRIVQNPGFAVGFQNGIIAFPFRTVPMPRPVFAVAPGEQAHAHGVVHQFKRKSRNGVMHHAQLLPIHRLRRLGLAQLG